MGDDDGYVCLFNVPTVFQNLTLNTQTARRKNVIRSEGHKIAFHSSRMLPSVLQLRYGVSHKGAHISPFAFYFIFVLYFVLTTRVDKYHTHICPRSITQILFYSRFIRSLFVYCSCCCFIREYHQIIRHQIFSGLFFFFALLLAVHSSICVCLCVLCALDNNNKDHKCYLTKSRRRGKVYNGFPYTIVGLISHYSRTHRRTQKHTQALEKQAKIT